MARADGTGESMVEEEVEMETGSHYGEHGRSKILVLNAVGKHLKWKDDRFS